MYGILGVVFTICKLKMIVFVRTTFWLFCKKVTSKKTPFTILKASNAFTNSSVLTSKM